MNPETSLHRTLRAGDPAGDASLDAAEAARLRARLDAAIAESAGAGWWPRRAVWAGVALTALALALGLGVPRSPAPSPAPAPAATATFEDQQVQFETADGVRIIWVLSRNVNL